MPPSSLSLPPLLQLMRPHQWVKNVLLFFPVILAHRLLEPDLFLKTAFAAAVFSLMASAVYVLNDRMDVESDRIHPDKKHRPLAAGTFPLRAALPTSLLLGLISLGLAFSFFPGEFGLLLIGYLAANSLYSGFLKQVPILDAVFLTLMFVLRILAGGVTGGVSVSIWLMSFSLFFFLSIAFAKRVQELQLALQDRQASEKQIRGYHPADLPCLSQLGISSGLISVLVLALYMNSSAMILQYRNPEFLWLLSPLMLFWIGRFWLLTLRGRMSHDPILFALKDRTSYVVLALLMAVLQTAYRLPDFF